MRLITSPGACFDNVVNYLAAFAGILLILSLVAVNVEVVARYGMGIGLSWVTEITEFAIVYIVFLGATWVLRRDRHVKMDFMVTRLNLRARRFLLISTSIIGAIVWFITGCYGVMVVWERFETGYLHIGGIVVPSAPLLVCIPVGSFLLFVQFLRRAHACHKSWGIINERIER